MTIWVDNQAPPIDEINLNKIEVGIADAHDHMADADIHVSSGEQTLIGIKTFDSSPVVPEPTEDM